MNKKNLYPSLSIIITCYNHAEPLKVQLEAQCKQSEFITELLLIDDGSTDHSYEVMESFAKRFTFIRILRNSINKGIMYSVKRAYDEAKGELICFQSADDIALPNFYRSTVQALQRFPDAAYACGDCVRVYEASGQEGLGRPGLSDHVAYISPTEMAEFQRSGKYLFAHGQTIVYRRQLLDNCGGIRFDTVIYSDILPQYLAGLRYGFCYIPEKLSKAIIAETTWSAMQTRDRKKMATYTQTMASILTSEKFNDIRMLVARSTVLTRHAGMLGFIMANVAVWPLFSLKDWLRIISIEIVYILYAVLPEPLKKLARIIRGTT